jgi:hypothetical protein
MEISLNKPLNKVVKTSETELLAAEKAELLSEINIVKCDLQNAYNNLNYVSDPLMIDYYTYQIKAYETRFEYLIKKAKEIGINQI